MRKAPKTEVPQRDLQKPSLPEDGQTNDTLPTAVVVGLDCITGLQTARILAGHGIPVVALAGDLGHFACRTKVCDRIVASDLKSEQLIETLERLGPGLGQRAVLYPCTDLSVLEISRHRDRLADWYHVALPEHGIVEMLMDKIAFVTHAEAAGLAIPATFVLTNRADAENAAKALSYPSVVKPPMKTREWERNTKAKVFQVTDAADLLATYDRTCDWADVLLAQEWVEGGDDSLYSCNGYFDTDGRPLATFVARKLRQWPPHTGTSSLGEECRNDEVLTEAIKLFSGVGFWGLAYLEMKRDARTGQHFIIEPNIGRPTGRSAIAEKGGVDLLFTKYCDVLGLSLPPDREQRYVGAKWLDMRRDTQSAVYYWRQGELSLREWRRSWKGPKAHAVWSRSDPRPFAAELRLAAAKARRAVTHRTD